MVTKPLRGEAGTEVPAGSEATAQAGAEVPGDIRTGIEAGDTVRGEAVPEVEACDTEAEGGETSAGRPVGVTTASEVSAKVSGEAEIRFTEVRAAGEAGAEVPACGDECTVVSASRLYKYLGIFSANIKNIAL